MSDKPFSVKLRIVAWTMGAMHFAPTPENVLAWSDEAKTLEAQLAEAERNAARYRFLRGDGNEQSAYWPEERGLWGGQELDDAIDAELCKAAA